MHIHDTSPNNTLVQKVAGIICIIAIIFILGMVWKNSSDSKDEPAKTANAIDTVAEGYIGISSIDDLKNISNDLSNHYQLLCDLDLSGCENWEPLGSEEAPFTGIFNGNGHVIQNLNINIDTTKTISGGLFGFVEGGQIHDLGVTDGNILVSVNAQISAYAEAANTMCGGIAAWLNNDSVVDKCCTSGTIDAQNSTSYTYTSGISASGENGVVSNCAVLMETINTNGSSTIYHPVSYFAARQDNVVNKDLPSGSFNITTTFAKGYTTISQNKPEKQKNYTKLGWDFENTWYMDTIPALINSRSH